jgi:hypothetical protein
MHHAFEGIAYCVGVAGNKGLLLNGHRMHLTVTMLLMGSDYFPDPLVSALEDRWGPKLPITPAS